MILLASWNMAITLRVLPHRGPLGRSLRWLLGLGAAGVGPFLLAQSGSLDPTFNPGTGVTNTVESIAVQSDGRIVLGGDFSSFNGMARTNVVRLNPDGSADTNFVPGSAVGSSSLGVYAVALQSDGKVVLGGNFTGALGTNLLRLNTNGAVDSSFAAATDDAVNALVVQTNGSIVIGGFFTQANGAPRTGIARLNTSAGLDASFNPSLAGGSSAVYGLALQSDGKIVVAGRFTSVNGTPTTNIARLNTNGSLDTTFQPVSVTGQFPAFYAVAVDGQGRALAAGDFSSVNGVTHTNLVRLNADGTLDATFSPAAGTDAYVLSIAVQSDGKILVGGLFTFVNGTPRNYLARLNADGTLDASFVPGSGPNYLVYSLAVQSDCKVLVGGAFTQFNGTPRGGIARLQNLPQLVNPLFSNSVFNVSISTVAGQNYILQLKNSLTDIVWMALPSVPGDGTLKTLTDPSATAGRRFYRVQVQ